MSRQRSLDRDRASFEIYKESKGEKLLIGIARAI
ncbi:phage terminase small subunit-related protein [Bacillus sp. CGMCC 1.60114]